MSIGERGRRRLARTTEICVALAFVGAAGVFLATAYQLSLVGSISLLIAVLSVLVGGVALLILSALTVRRLLGAFWSKTESKD